MASRQNLLQFAVCVITSKITKLIIMFYCVIVRFKQNKFISSKINDNVKQIDVSRLVSMLSTSGPWYGKTRVGVNTLKKNFIPNLCKESSLSVHYTNHSLWATAITRMYEHGVTEKMSNDKSRHRSIKGLRAYQHTSVAEEKAAGNSINAELVLMLNRKPVQTIFQRCTLLAWRTVQLIFTTSSFGCTALLFYVSTTVPQ